MIAYKSLPEKDIKISVYCKKYKFTGICSLLIDHSPLKELDICTIVSLY